MRISDWSSDVCSSDLRYVARRGLLLRSEYEPLTSGGSDRPSDHCRRETMPRSIGEPIRGALQSLLGFDHSATGKALLTPTILPERDHLGHRSEEHTSELQSLMRNSYAVFCLKKK